MKGSVLQRAWPNREGESTSKLQGHNYLRARLAGQTECQCIAFGSKAGRDACVGGHKD